jgi:hypothetical protein
MPVETPVAAFDGTMVIGTGGWSEAIETGIEATMSF